ncbi:putative TEA/ATTS domain family protein [Lyophyllum shimeji]|uniref:TEA/ATTS domain family protein n=1 Tax=Lyophyllum shimeji TaxID=47721 RepID=A0A9P3UIW5_LYOSH|nr:putative TEA/ATTS domain family protein [Lyophyllum shimeji]
MSSSSKSRKPDSCTSTLTPQRKHRKLLKDGSGAEVWPESVEAIFVKGLHEYWESPWATYCQSRGRSRWRNQFLVDYLQKAGVNRTKKQVASHIQVLRNMWKGEHEYYLVAGGEESGLLETPVKLEDRSLITLDFDDADGASSSSASPDYSPPDFQSDFPPSPSGAFNGSHTIGVHSTVSKEFPHISPYPQETIFTTSIPSSLSMYPVDVGAHQSREQLPVQNAHYALGAYSSSCSQTYGPTSKEAGANGVPDVNVYPTNSQPPNRTTAVCLLADGMTPFSINLDALMPSQESARTTLTLKVRLGITPVDDIRSSSTLHGFFGTVSLSKLWVTSGKCMTRVYTNSHCVSEEVGALEVSNVERGIVNTILPESSLSRCRWLDASIPTTLTQEIIVDGRSLIHIIYELDRSSGSVMPSAQLLGYQNRNAPSNTSSPYVQNSTRYPALPTEPVSSSRHTTQTSLSCFCAFYIR